MSTRKVNANLKSSSTSSEFVDDDQSMSDSNDDESNNAARSSKSNNTDDEQNSADRRQKTNGFRNPKSHRLIEKRRRDRLNRSLADLLDLVPHQKPENQRRIEKIEIIEMAIKQLRTLIAANQKSKEEKSTISLESYRRGYQHGTMESYEFVQRYSHSERLNHHLFDFIKERDIEVKSLKTVPEKRCNFKARTNIVDENESESVSQVPSFVLHPSGTHYIPIYLDASLISFAFRSTNNDKSQILQCHPISIPVNFHANSSNFDHLDMQNINVMGSTPEKKLH